MRSANKMCVANDSSRKHTSKHLFAFVTFKFGCRRKIKSFNRSRLANIISKLISVRMRSSALQVRIVRRMELHSYSNTISDEILKLIVNNFHVFVQIHCVFFSSSEQNLAQSLSFHKTNLTSLVLWIVIYDS